MENQHASPFAYALAPAYTPRIPHFSDSSRIINSLSSEKASFICA